MERLVSAIMPTTPAREALSRLAIKCFNKQDWPNKELIIVSSEESIGYKLNRACEQAKGDVLIRWDDDDWSSPTRISEQMSRLAKNDLTGFYQIYFWDINNLIASEYRGAKSYCLGTSMCFTRSYWESNRFIQEGPRSNLGEDLEFQRKAFREKKLFSVPADQTMVARLHGNNIGSGRVKFPQVPVERLPKAFMEDEWRNVSIV